MKTPSSSAPSSSSSLSRPPLWKVWLVAARPHTLTASVAPVIVGYYATKSIILSSSNSITTTNSTTSINNLSSLAIQWVLFCMLIQLGTNLHNDYADFVKGADTDKRLGQARATQKGWLTPNQTLTGSNVVLVGALLLGIGFLHQICQFETTTSQQIVCMALIVSSSLFNAVAYTGGPYPLGYIGMEHVSIAYSGLGDLFVMLYFGLVATLTLPFLYACTNPSFSSQNNSEFYHYYLLYKILPYAIQVGSLGTNIIVVNNLRDRHTDVSANKRTLAVRFGATFCLVEYVVMVAIAYGLVFWDALVQNNDYNGGNDFSYWRFLPLLSFPFACKEMISVFTKDGGALNPHVGGTAKVQFLFCLLLGVALRHQA